ncbi:uncharacterized protein LOC128740755 [Sabethes cyaneus]|uniref:uncharacterized protein LOC128740755 n=1 Tax=Sabethes cyaneus TaxID=53552 RepID=UPI00237DBFC3|nr:uncharacterized protein LOC128740755 [Sabethes cyaneus]
MEFDYHRLAIVFGPILSHAASLSLVDLFEHFRKAPESMSPDIASLMFVAATSIIVENWLENYMLRPRIDSAKTFVLVVCKIVLNITICELALRLLWIPTLYLLRYLRDEKILLLDMNLHIWNNPVSEKIGIVKYTAT